MRLVIAEKPSVGRSIAQAISTSPAKKDGYIDCGTVDGEETYVSWAQGHLIDLADPKTYGDRWAKWSLDGLPVDPGDDWKWKVSTEKGAASRYKALVPLIGQADTLIDACDPDREGSGIFHRIVSHARALSKPAYRLWANSMDADGIRKAWKQMRPEQETIGLSQASEARAKADWITGMTASRAYSLLYNRRCSIGRVETPTLAMIVERDRQIKNHVSTPFWTIRVPMGSWTLVSEKITDKTAAEQAAAAIPATVTVSRVERRQAEQKPPHLYDLTSLQRDANSRYGLTAAQTLQTVQRLYEEGIVTYPRTDSQYITSDDLAGFRDLFSEDAYTSWDTPAGMRWCETKPEEMDFGQVVNNEKVEGHTALVVTEKLEGNEDRYGLTDPDEPDGKIVGLILLRMWEAVSPSRLHETIKVTAVIDGITYTATEDRTIRPGWTANEHTDKDDAQAGHIPDDLTDGDSPAVAGPAETKEGHTAPPKPYTDASLLSAMEHASRQLDDEALKAALDDDSVHSGGIGTPATRAAIIEKIIRNKYAEYDGKKIRSTKDGQDLITIVAPGLKSVETTARMEQGLTDIADNRLDEQTWLDRIHERARQILPDAQTAFQPAYKQEEQEQESYGPCPVCGKSVVKTKGGYWKCSANKSVKNDAGKWVPAPGACTYGIWKKTVGNNKKRLTDSLVRKALAGEKPILKDGFHSARTDKDYDVILVPDAKWGIETKFPPRK